MVNSTVTDKKSFYINVLIGAGIGAAVCLVLLLGIAAVMVLSGIGNTYASPLSSVAAAVGAGIGGYFAARRNKSKGLICGALVAVIMFLVFSVIGAVLGSSITLMSLIRFVILLLSGVIGGILGVNKRDKRKIV